MSGTVGRTIGTAGAAVLTLALGCAGATPPTAARSEAMDAIRAARELGAASSARAAYHLDLAEEQVVRADAMIRDGRMMEGERWLDRARADAELAAVLAREADVRARADELEQSRVRAMHEAP